VNQKNLVNQKKIPRCPEFHQINIKILLKRTSDEEEARGEDVEDDNALTTEATSEDDGDGAGLERGADLGRAGSLADIEGRRDILSGVEAGGFLHSDGALALAKGDRLGGRGGSGSLGDTLEVLHLVAASAVERGGATELGHTLRKQRVARSGGVLTGLGHPVVVEGSTKISLQT